MVAGQLKDADWEQDITCDRCVAKDRVVHSRNGYRARPEGICCFAMNARSPRAGLGQTRTSARVTRTSVLPSGADIVRVTNRFSVHIR
jgi:hypothetical protein